ncbi:MAG: ATP-grasp domain-containing protein, partial [Methylomarinum sp.]|nr:ATP-grasp domain-containing protein [Methylomarinum sp.]
MSEIKNMLIVANSGRMLAQLAKNIGFEPLVIDCFSDADTQVLALDCIKVDSLALECVKAAFSVLSLKYTITHVVYGSGLECYPATLAFLNQNLTVLGNTPDAFLAIQNKPQFFQTLIRLQIPFPETTFEPPINSEGWLIKPMQGEGGIGVKKYKCLPDDSADIYWQKYQPGIAMSVLFMANGYDFKIIGFNKQFVTSLVDNDFVFSGVISQPEISEWLVNIVSAWLNQLVVEFSLKGINSLDFIVNDTQCYVLEINPRPSASMQLYKSSILSAHIDSFSVERLASIERPDDYQGYQIIFAESDIYINKNTLWPAWVVDIPQADAFINTGMPICSIIARGKNEQQVKDLLLLKQLNIKKLL